MSDERPTLDGWSALIVAKRKVMRTDGVGSKAHSLSGDTITVAWNPDSPITGNFAATWVLGSTRRNQKHVARTESRPASPPVGLRAPHRPDFITGTEFP